MLEMLIFSIKNERIIKTKSIFCTVIWIASHQIDILFKTAVMTETAFRGAQISGSGPVAVAVDATWSVRTFEPVRTGETCIHAHAEYPVAEAVHHIGGVAVVVHSSTDLRIHWLPLTKDLKSSSFFAGSWRALIQRMPSEQATPMPLSLRMPTTVPGSAPSQASGEER